MTADTINFPLANVTKDWSFDAGEDHTTYTLEDQYFYENNEKTFKKYYLHQKYVDSNGDIYKIIGRTVLHVPFFKRLPFFTPHPRAEFSFAKTFEKMDIEEIRTWMTRQITLMYKDATHPEAIKSKNSWIDQIKEAKTIAEIILG